MTILDLNEALVEEVSSDKKHRGKLMASFDEKVVTSRSRDSDSTLDISFSQLSLRGASSLSGPQLTHSNSLRGKSTFSVEEVLLATDNFSETKFIGSGGQSTVYKGIIRGTTVAVKKFHDASINELLSEVNFSLRHPHVVLVLGCCQEANCVVSEFLPGGSLHDRLVDPNGLGLNAGDILRISLEMLSALMFLHNENIAHRDLKPANVLLDEHKKVKIADMGMAVKVEGAKDYGLFGTEGYTDPYYTEKGILTKSSDIYSFGLILLQLLTSWRDVRQIHHYLARCTPKRGVRNLEAAFKEFSVRIILPSDCSAVTKSHALATLWLGLQCVEKVPQQRPNLDTLWEELKHISEKMNEGVLIDLADFKKDTKILLPLPLTEDDIVPEQSGYLRPVSNTNSTSFSRSSTHSSHSDYSSLVKEGRSLMDEDPTKAFNLYRNAAMKGSVEAQYLVGNCFENGMGVDRDFERSFYWYGRAAFSGSAQANCALGRFFADGIRVPINETEAARYFQIAAELKDANGILRLAYHYNFGFGVVRDPQRAQILAGGGLHTGDNEDPSFQYSVGLCHQYGIGTPKSIKTALEWYKKSADQWYPPAWHKVGEHLLQDKSNPNHEKEAFKCLELASTCELPNSQCAFGECYRDGIGCKKDFKKAVDFFMQASKKGHYIAQCNLAKCYSRGEGVGKDLVKAAQYFELSAKKGFVYAQYNIANCFLDGIGVEKSMEEGIKWLLKASKQVDTLKGKDALVLLKQVTDQLASKAKAGAKKGGTEAIKCLALISEEDYGFGQYRLGLCFQNGWSVNVNVQEAEYQLQRAVANGEKAAASKLKKLSRK